MRLAALALGAALLVGAAPQADDSPEALLQRTKTTTVTYASYAWVYWRNQEGERTDNWVVEFHSGDWHRVEAPKYRTIANCRTHKGWAYNVETGALTASDKEWINACGISTDGQIVSVDLVGTGKDARYGPVRTLRVTDRLFVRYYMIDARGVIVRGNWTRTNKSPSPCSQSEPLAILPRLPAGNWFTPQSLKQSAVPASYKVAPKGSQPVGLSGRSC